MNADTVRHVVQRALETEENFDCVKSLEGSDHEVWYIGSDLVFRASPNSAENEQNWKIERKARDLIKKIGLHSQLIPEIIAMGILFEHECIFTVETRAPGVPVEACAATARTEADLVSFLSMLSKVPLEGIKDVGIQTDVPDDLEELIEDSKIAWNELVSGGHSRIDVDKLKQILDSSDPANGADEAVSIQLLHGDLKGEHIFIDPETGALQGIIDWSDICIGDAEVDIRGLAISVGQDMAQRIGRKMRLPQTVLTRARLTSQCHSVLLLKDCFLDGEESGPPLLLRAQFKRAFESTQVVSAFDHLQLGLADKAPNVT